jgi:broad specificity phosphatase PhoE
MNRLFLVRHGENQANLTKEFSHRLIDYSLTPKGVLQAQQTAVYFRDKAVDHVFASPLRRAVETAEQIVHETGAPLTVLEAFRELDVGDLEREPPSAKNWKLHDDVLMAWWAGRPEVRFPGGENYLELVARARRGYEQVLRGRQDETLVVVAHGGSLGAPLLQLCPSLTPEVFRGTEHHNCAVTELSAGFLDGALHLELVRWAACGHLTGDAAAFVSSSPSSGELNDI